MIKQLALAMGLSMAAGTGFVGYDYNRQSAFSDDPAFGLLLYLENTMARNGNRGAKGSDPRRASLPQASNWVDASDSEWGPRTGEEELRAMAPYVPEVQEYLNISDERERNELWARIRHKASGQGDGQGRLADIHKRDLPQENYEDLSIWSLFGMSTLDQYKNREAIGSGMTRAAIKQHRQEQKTGIVWQKTGE